MIMIGGDHPYLAGNRGPAMLIMVEFFKIIIGSRGTGERSAIPYFGTSYQP